MHALSIRQPYVEQILRGVKRIEYRSRPTTRLGERFYLYAAKQPGPPSVFAQLGCEPGDLVTGVIVGTAIITQCVRGRGRDPSGRAVYEWHLASVRRLARPRRVKRHPQPAWFGPF